MQDDDWLRDEKALERSLSAKARADAEATRLANRDSDEEWEKQHESDSDEEVVRFKAAAAARKKAGKGRNGEASEKEAPKWKVMQAEAITQKHPITAVTARGRTLVTGIHELVHMTPLQ
jgi:hypothetical protein